MILVDGESTHSSLDSDEEEQHRHDYRGLFQQIKCVNEEMLEVFSCHCFNSFHSRPNKINPNVCSKYLDNLWKELDSWSSDAQIIVNHEIL